jgi:LacI family transcriptional regulator
MANAAIEVLAREVPLVVVNRVVADLPTVVMDVANGARQAIDHLVGLGHRELLYLGGPRSSWTNKEIRRSAVAAARSHGVSLTVLDSGSPTEAGGAAAADAVRREGVTAVLAYNDLLAIGLIGALKRLGLTVPKDISVVGIDDIPLSNAVQLTTVATPTAAAGRTAVDMLLSYDSPARTGRGPGRTVVEQPIRTSALTTLPTTLITRQSTGPGPYAPASIKGE